MPRLGSWLPALVGVSSVVILVTAMAVSSHLRTTQNRSAAVGPEGADMGEEQATIPLTGDQRCTGAYYEDLIQKDAVRFGATQTSVEVLGLPLRGGVEFDGEYIFSKKNRTLSTPHLQITSGVGRLYPDPRGGHGARTEHVTLSIHNRTSAPIAYRVDTKISGWEDCAAKGNLPHNAIALRAQETVVRSECQVGPDTALAVTRVEVYELTDLGYRYLSRIEPSAGAAFDMRVAAGHNFAGLPPCHNGSLRDLDASPGEAWRTMVDFYVRHSCDVYSPQAGYRASATAVKVPACDPPPPETPVKEAPPVVAERPPDPKGKYALALLAAGILLFVLFWRKPPPKAGAVKVNVLDMKDAGDEFDNR